MLRNLPITGWAVKKFRKIKEMANANYVKSGYSEAKQVIDNMPVDQLKDYLKKLIEDNIAVGVEIIKGQK